MLIVINFSHLEGGREPTLHTHPPPYPSFNPNFWSISPWIERVGEGYTANISRATWSRFKDNILCWLFKIDLPLPRMIALFPPNWYLCYTLPLCFPATTELTSWAANVSFLLSWPSNRPASVRSNDWKWAGLHTSLTWSYGHQIWPLLWPGEFGRNERWALLASDPTLHTLAKEARN